MACSGVSRCRRRVKQHLAPFSNAALAHIRACMHTAHLSFPEDFISSTSTHQQKPKNEIKRIYSALLEQRCRGLSLIVQMFQF